MPCDLQEPPSLRFHNGSHGWANSPTGRTLLAGCSYSIFFSYSPPCPSPPSPRSPLGSESSIESSIALFPHFPARAHYGFKYVPYSHKPVDFFFFSFIAGEYAFIAAVGTRKARQGIPRYYVSIVMMLRSCRGPTAAASPQPSSLPHCALQHGAFSTRATPPIFFSPAVCTACLPPPSPPS